MPMINRIRIVNFSYNNNNRHIIDECFNFYSGENALLSLANGGGKSVLVQAMLQPILPKASLLGRKFSDFFTGSRAPSYIMIEWKLEEDTGHLLTGIAITTRVTHSTNEDEQNTDIRYFTFTSFYESANAFDIRDIPVCEQTGSSIRIASFMEFKKLLQKECGKGEFDVAVFDSTREDQSIYERKLNSYFISRDEWKELMMKINEAEHGVSEVFSECKTSRKVMEQWIIKYIEKVLDKSSEGEMSDHKKLEIMMGQVAQSLVENEKHIKEFKAIDEFKAEADNLAKETNGVLKSLDEEDKLKKEISSGYAVLKAQGNVFDNRLVELDIKKKDIAEELAQLEQEKKSEEFYKLKDEIDILIEKLDKLNNIKVELINEKAAANHGLRLQQAAEKYKKICEKQTEISELTESITNASKDQEELNIRLNQVRFSLKCLLQQELDIKNEQIQHKEEQLVSIRQEHKDIEHEKSESQKKQNLKNSEKGKLSVGIDAFEKDEPSILKSIGLELYRNPILNELDNKEVDKAGAGLYNDLQNKINILEEKKDRLEKCSLELGQAEKQKELLHQKEKTQIAALTEAESLIKEYHDKKKNIVMTLNRFNIGEEYLFDREYIVREVREYLYNWERKSFALKMEIVDLEKRIRGIETGENYLPAKLLTTMRENNLEPFTGEKYLREASEEQKLKLLQNNPLLPYALIVTEKEQELLRSLTSEQDFNQIVPIIRYKEIEQITDIDSLKISFITSSKNAYLDGDGLKAYIKSLSLENERSIQNLKETEAVIDRINRDYSLIDGFVFSEEQECEIYSRRDSIDQEFKELTAAINKCSIGIRALSEEKERLNKDIVEGNNNISFAEERMAAFKRYIERNAVYMEQLVAYNELTSELERIDASYAKLCAREKSLNEKVLAVNQELSAVKNELKILEAKMLEVEDCSEAEVIIAPVFELEGMLYSLRKEQNNVLEELQTRKRRLDKDIKDEERSIEKLRLEDSEEYKRIVYSEDIESQLQDKIDILDKSIGYTTNDYNTENLKLREINTQKNFVEKSMAGRKLIPVEKIRGSFDARKTALNREMIDVENIEKIVNTEKQELQVILVRIDTTLGEISSSLAGEYSRSYEEVTETITGTLTGYIQASKTAEKYITQFDKISSGFILKYEGCEEGTIRDALKGLKGQLQLLEHNFDKYYYLSERLAYYESQLSNILSLMESKLQQLEHSRKDLVEHAFLEAKRIYTEIPKISENSAVEIDGVRKRVLDISFKDMEDELAAREKMSNYISECLSSLTALIKDNADDSRLRRDLEKYMSTKELFNVISPLESCVINAYKVDLNERNRRMLPWEEIIVKNSGGEKFVAYFSLLIALISYSRKQQRGSSAFRNREESKVLIMDNPFGPITSGHLLKPMFDIAKKYNTQLICLSDIKQGDVINSFDLIYMVKIRQTMHREDYLEIEPIIQKKLAQDERLEKAYYHYIRPEQMSLFE